MSWRKDEDEDEQARLREGREARARLATNVTQGEFDQLAKVLRERLEALEKDSHPPVPTDVPERLAQLERFVENPERQQAWDELNELLAESPSQGGPALFDRHARVRQLAKKLQEYEVL